MTSGASHDLRLAQLREKDERPNILIMLTDQQRADTIRAAGAEWMHTPNLDRLAAGGCLYNNAYTPNPICMPARYNMLTGLTARHHGYPDNGWGYGMPLDLTTFPRILSDHGYETRTIGKNHFYPPRRHHGYLNMELMQEVPAFREQDEYLKYLKEQGYGNIHDIHGVRNLLYMLPQRALMPEEHHGTTWVADRAIDFIETNRGRHPWLLKMGWIAPHPPFNVPDEFADLYKDADLPEPHVSETPVSSLAEENKMLGDLPTGDYNRRMREMYYGAISHVDHHVGCVLKSLEDTGQLDNTLIIFTSDHGEMLGDYETYQKWLPYDSCARIPFIVHFPKRMAAGTVKDDFIDLNDVFPTILDAAGIAYPGEHELPGESVLTPKGRKDRTHQYVEYSEGNRRWVSLRDSHFKYNYYYAEGREELFDLEKNPQETRNLLVTRPEAYEQVRRNLRQRLIAYEEKWGLPGCVQDGDFVRLEEFQPAPYRNRAFPIFHEKLTDPQEAAAMNNFFDEVAEAISKEPVVNLEELDLAAWQKNGHFSDEQIRQLLEKKK
ncbi:MAG: sulfatase-like hydrolase/transferase [bacterium]|nr:sulfatase-like hydrolase/transferase [bacterium]